MKSPVLWRAWIHGEAVPARSKAGPGPSHPVPTPHGGNLGPRHLPLLPSRSCSPVSLLSGRVGDTAPSPRATCGVPHTPIFRGWSSRAPSPRSTGLGGPQGAQAGHPRGGRGASVRAQCSLLRLLLAHVCLFSPLRSVALVTKPHVFVVRRWGRGPHARSDSISPEAHPPPPPARSHRGLASARASSPRPRPWDT